MGTPAVNDLQGLRIRMSVSEPELIAGYGGVTKPDVSPDPRTEACACGEVIFVSTPNPAVIAAAVSAHQQIAEHRAWRKRAGFE